MQSATSLHAPTLTTPWALRAWPPVLWQAGKPADWHFRHRLTRVEPLAEHGVRAIGQTVWAGSLADGEAGVAWDWVQVTGGVVAMVDPMAVVTNLCLVGDGGEVLTAWEAARYLNQIVYALPWQSEVQRALQA